MGAISDELLLGRLRKEAAAREAELAKLRAELAALGAALDEKLERLSARFTAVLGGRAVDSSALVESVRRAIAGPGFALAEDLLRLEARVSDGDITSLATIEEVKRVIATTQYALAEWTREVAAQFSTSERTLRAEVSETLQAYATKTLVDARRDEALLAVSGVQASVNTEASARATADGRTSGQYVLSVDADGKIAGLSLTAANGLSEGSGYDTASVTFTTLPGQTGSGAVATARVEGGKVVAVEFANEAARGSGYSIAPEVVITPGSTGSGAKAVATILDGKVRSVLLRPTSEMVVKADAFKVQTGAETPITPFLVTGSTVKVNGALVVDGTDSTLATLANNAAIPAVNFIGVFASHTLAEGAGRPLNSVYRNSADGHSYIRTLTGWALYLERGAQGIPGSTGPKGDKGDTGDGGINGTNGRRGSVSIARAVTVADWSDTEAELALQSRGLLPPVLLDQVTLYVEGGSYSQTRFWAGPEPSPVGGWQTIAAYINGNLLVKGTIAGDRFVAGTSIASPVINGGQIMGGEIVVTSPLGMHQVGDSGVYTITGGVSNGIQHGAQIDLAGTFLYGANPSTGAGLGGALLLQAGDGEDGRIEFRTGRESPPGVDPAYGFVRMTILRDGNITVNKALSAAALSATTTISGATITGTTISATSARRHKKRIRTLRGALGTVEKLRGVTFDWKKLAGGRSDFGVIAEEVLAVLPSAVSRDERGRVAGVEYGKLSAVLIQAVKELSAEVRTLKKQLHAQRTKKRTH